MARYRLLAGQHVAADHSQKPVEVKDAAGTVVKRYPTRTYKVGEVVESDTDLAGRFGAEKFKLADGKPGETVEPASSPAVAPGGQVSSGHQITAGGVPRAMTAEEVANPNLSGVEAATAGKDKKLGRQVPPNLDAMSVKELHDHAAAEEINLHGATSKQDMLKAIRTAQRQ